GAATHRDQHAAGGARGPVPRVDAHPRLHPHLPPAPDAVRPSRVDETAGHEIGERAIQERADGPLPLAPQRQHLGRLDEVLAPPPTITPTSGCTLSQVHGAQARPWSRGWAWNTSGRCRGTAGRWSTAVVVPGTIPVAPRPPSYTRVHRPRSATREESTTSARPVSLITRTRILRAAVPEIVTRSSRPRR